MEETNRKGFEQYDSLLKEYEKVKKEKTKKEKEYEPNVTLELTKFIRKMLSFQKKKKVLQGIHKVNTDIHEKLREAEEN